MARGTRTQGLLTQGIASAIRARRAELRKTAAEVYGPAQIAKSTYSHIEGGRASIDVDQLGAIATALNTTMSQLVQDGERIAQEQDRLNGIDDKFGL